VSALIRNLRRAIGIFIGDVSLANYLVDPTGAADSTSEIQRALNDLGAKGGRVIVPPGTYNCSGAITIPARVTIQGKGRVSSVLQFTHTGDGIQSTWPINSSTAAWIKVRDLGLTCTNNGNTGAGFVDVGGSFVDLDNVYVQGFMYQVVFDQTEIATLHRSEIIQPSYSKAGVWLVNGADHTAGANAGFTNRITITATQFNAAAGAGPNIVDDGGGCHTFMDNNLNAGTVGILAAGVGTLIIQGNECEGHSGSAIYLADKTAGIGQRGVAATYVGPCFAPKIEANNISDYHVASHIVIDDCQGGTIRGNMFGQASGQNIMFNNGASSKASAVIIEGNSKLIRGAYRQAAPFLGGWSQALRANVVRQSAVTYNPGALAAGTVECFPATMELIRPNTRLWCVNEDGTNGEQVIVKSVTATSFTAAFASAKAANFLVYGLMPGDQEEGTWTPTLAGSVTAGANTYSVQSGTYSRRGGLVFITATLTINVKDAAMSGQLHINGLPFLPLGPAGQTSAVMQLIMGGWTAAGYTQTVGAVIYGTNYIAINIAGSGQAANALTAAQLTGTVTLSVSGCYLTGDL
jgi:hypothetical protein